MRLLGRSRPCFAAMAAVALVMTTGAAEPDWFTTPPPPRSQKTADIDDWVKRYIVVGDYLQTGYNSNTLAFVSTSEVAVAGPRRLRIWLRFENFRPAIVADAEIRSARILTEFDCSRSLYRQVRFELYSGNNLTGMPSTQVMPDAAWKTEAPNSASAVNAKLLCGMLEAAEHEPP